jgi:MFS transporter, DHA1 family, multidrug resistance protein
MLRGPGALVTSMFLGSFAWAFAFISLPFYVQQISTSGPAATLRWTGWIVGISSLVAVVTGPAWGRWAATGDPKRYYVLIQLLQGLGFFVMAVTRTVLELFAARVLLGFTGAASTLAFMIVGRQMDGPAVRRQVAGVQMAMTIGQVTGPLGGAIAAGRLGFRPSFVLGGLILLGSSAFVHWGVPLVEQAERHRAEDRRIRPRDLALDTAVVLALSMQLFFLTSVLPSVLADLGVAEADFIEVGGWLVFVSAAATALGAAATPKLAGAYTERQLVTAMLVSSSVCAAALALPRGVWGYTVVRFLQVLCAAPAFPLVVARAAQQRSGLAVGVINSARIGASFAGPVIATSVLAAWPSVALYLILAAGSLACLPLAILGRSRGR